jgi:phosphoglycerate dehydrogenase-like enzyme
MLAANRNFPEFWINEPPKGKWAWNIQERDLDDGRSIQPRSLAGQRLGIFGFGGIGQQVARLGLAFAMDVVACRRSNAPSEVDGVRLIGTVDELVAECDHVVLCAPQTTQTEGIVSRAVLENAKPGLHLVNVARGTLIDHDALRDWLDNDGAARASLDVCEPEPLLDPSHWLYHHNQVFLTPHSSWMGPPYMASALDQFCANLRRYLSGEPLEGVVDKALGY